MKKSDQARMTWAGMSDRVTVLSVNETVGL